MEQSTHLADCIDSTEYQSRYDSQAKNLTARDRIKIILNLELQKE